MKLHNINLRVRERLKQRIGRGGKRGSYSGRGVKGQKSRAGRKLRPAQRDLILRLPKMRGFRNKIKKDKPIIFNLGDLSLLLKTHSTTRAPLTVNKEFLAQCGIISSKYEGEIKILSQGDIGIPVIIQDIAVSKKTAEKIEKAGGKVK